MNKNDKAYTTVHGLHDDPKQPIAACDECNELIQKQQEYDEARVSQQIEDKYHSHGNRE